jgi:Exocyst complex component Sec5
MCAAPTYHRGSAFQPSTWAEVEDAAASRKDTTSRTSDPIIPEIIAFTNSPARCVDAAPDVHRSAPALPKASSARPLGRSSNSAHSRASNGGGSEELGVRHLPPTPVVRRQKRGALQMDDLLGLGRVDLESEAFVRRYTFDHPAPTAVPKLPAWQPSNAECDSGGAAPGVATVLNPCCQDFNPALYLSRLHADTSLAELRAGVDTLSGVSTSLRRGADEMRAAAHASLALAAVVVEQTRRSVHSAAGFAKLSESITSDCSQFNRAGAALDEKYRHILDRQTRIDTLKRVLRVVRRFNWLLTLPATLRSDGDSDVKRVEEAAQQLARAKEWTGVQDSAVGPARVWIQRELDDGLEEFVSCLEKRLSRAATGDRAHLARLVKVLESVGREYVVEVALGARLGAARELLVNAGRKGAVGAIVRARVGDVGGQGDVVELMTRVSSAFIDGLTEFWDLARVVVSRPKWGDLVDLMLPTLVNDYAEAVRSALLAESQLVTRDAALEIGRAQRRAVREVRVPAAYLSPLDEVASQVVDMHLSSLTRAAKASAGSIARASFEGESFGTQLLVLTRALVHETVAEARDLVGMESSRRGGAAAGGPPGGVGGETPDSHVEALANACVRIPEYVVHALRELVTERSRGPHILNGSLASSSLRSTAASSQTASEAAQTSTSQTSVAAASDAYGSAVMGTARCCGEFVEGGGIAAVCEMVKELVWSSRLERRKQSVTKRIRTVRLETVKVYARRLSPEVRWSARRIAELRSAEGLRTSQSMEIDSASAQAVEVLLNVCLAVCRAHHLGARVEELNLVEKQLTEQVADVLLSSMGSSSGTTDMAAQIWVDISFLTAVLGDAGGGHLGASKARDGFAQALSMASAAVRRSGFAFGTAEEETLRGEAVEPSVTRARMLRQAMRADGGRRELPSSQWVRSAMEATIRLAVESPPWPVRARDI